MLLLNSCGGEGEHPLKEYNYYLEESNREWMAPEDPGTVFIMRDQNGISASFRFNSEDEYMGKSWSTVMGINTSTSYTEEWFQDFSSGFGERFSLSMRASSPPQGDNIRVSLGDIAMEYDFDFEVVHHIDTPFGYKYLLSTDKGYEVWEDGELGSKVEFLDSLTTEFGQYSDLMHFIFDDFREQWDTFTVTEIWLARNIGLVQYKLAGGITAARFEQ